MIINLIVIGVFLVATFVSTSSVLAGKKTKGNLWETVMVFSCLGLMGSFMFFLFSLNSPPGVALGQTLIVVVVSLVFGIVLTLLGQLNTKSHK